MIRVGSYVYTENGIARVTAKSVHRWNVMYEVDGVGFSGSYKEAEVQEMTSEETFTHATGAPDDASPQLPYDLDGIYDGGDQTSTLIPGGDTARGIPNVTSAYDDSPTVSCPNCGTEYDVTYIPDICDVCGVQLASDEDWDGVLHTASWADVRAKAQRLRREGRVEVLSKDDHAIHALVEGDNGTYETSVNRIGGTGLGVSQVSGWNCSCEWSNHAWDRTSFVGRLCAHGLAVYYEMQKNASVKTAAQWMRGDEVSYQDTASNGDSYYGSGIISDPGSGSNVLVIEDGGLGQEIEIPTASLEGIPGNQKRLQDLEEFENDWLDRMGSTTSDDYDDSGLGDPADGPLEFDGNNHKYDADELWGDNYDTEGYELLPPDQIEKNVKDVFGSADDEGIAGPELYEDEDVKESSLNTGWRTYKSASDMDDGEEDVEDDVEDDEDDSSITAVRMTRSQAKAAGIPQSVESQDIVAAFQQDADWLMSGSSATDTDFDLSQAAELHLAKIAGKQYSAGELAALISEGEDEGSRAANLHRLDLAQTHYDVNWKDGL